MEALPHRAPCTRCTADPVHHVCHRPLNPSLAALAAQEETRLARAGLGVLGYEEMSVASWLPPIEHFEGRATYAEMRGLSDRQV